MPSKPPIESFAPEMLAVLLRGAREEVRLKTTYRAASHFRQRLNSLRSRMRETKHELYSIVARAEIKILWGADAGLPDIEVSTSKRNVRYPTDSNSPAVLLLRPYDAELSTELQRLGIKEHKLDTTDVRGGDVDDILAEFSKGEHNES